MQTQTRLWLPPEALAPERVQPLIGRILDDWASHWFATARAAASPAFQDDWPAATGEPCWRSCPAIASVALTGAAQALVAGAMLGANVPAGALEKADRSVVEDLSSKCVDDLLVRLGRLASPASSRPAVTEQCIDLEDCSWWEISLAGGRRAFKLAIATAALIELVRSGLAAPRTVKIEPLKTGLGKQEIELAADLGRCAISLADLQTLAVGDVLVLDRTATEPVHLFVNGSASPLRASLEANEEHLALILASS